MRIIIQCIHYVTFFFIYLPFLIGKEIIKHYPHYVIFFFISLISLLLQYEAGNFKPIIFHDSPYPIDPVSLINKFSPVWRDIANFGYFDPSGPLLSFFYAFLSPTYILTNNNLVITQFVFLFTISNLIPITMYHLTRYLGINKILSILAGILYLANPYSIFYIWRILNTNIILYAALPIILLSIIKILRNENTKKYIVILLLAEFASIPSFVNPTYYFPFIVVTLSLSLSYSLIINRNLTLLAIKTIFLKNLIILSILILPLFAYIFSVIADQQQEYSIASGYFQGAETFYNKNTEHISLASLFSLTGLPPLYENGTWFSYQQIYLSAMANIVSVVVAVVIIGSLSILIFNKKVDKKVYPFIIILIISSILILKETAHPIFQNFPLILSSFREPYHKFGSGLALALIILFCYCIQQIFKIKTFPKYNFLKVALFLLVLFPVIYWISPFVSGNFIPTELNLNDHKFSAFTELPYKYMPAVNYLKKDKDIVNGNAKVIVYPISQDNLWCEGDKYIGNDILRFAGISTISTSTHINFQNERGFLNQLEDTAFLADQHYIGSLQLLGIKYILIRKQPCYFGAQSSNDLRNLSKSIEEKVIALGINKIMENNYYTLFKLNNTNLTHISIIKDPSFDSVTINNMSLFGISFNSNGSPGQYPWSQYQRISSSERILDFKNITEPFYVLLAESYDNGWKAFINGKEQIPDTYHFTVDNFANGWYINKTGSFNVKLYFEPQKYYEIGLMTCALVICFCLFFYFLFRIRKNVTNVLRENFRRKRA